MANKIYVDTVVLEQLSNQISQLQRSLSSAGEKVTRSVSEVKRVAPGQTKLIQKLGNVQKNVQKTADHAAKLAQATNQAANRWEEAENRISRQLLGQGGMNSEIAQALTGSALFGFFNGNLLSDILSGNEKDQIISNYEKEHPDQAKKLNDFLNSQNTKDLTQDDIRQIKYLAYTAKEPYRSVYLNSLNKYSIYTLHGNNCYYQPWQLLNSESHKVIYQYPDAFGSDPRGPYTVFFHECGHAIDDLSDESKWWGSDTESYKAYSNEMGKQVTLQEAINYDVYYNKNNTHSVASIADDYYTSRNASANSAEVDHVIRAFQNGNKSSLSKSELALYNHVKNEFSNSIGRAEKYESVTDVYGGTSKNNITDGQGYHHSTKYWNDRSSDAPAKELWAEYFSYNMANNTENLEHLKEYFPEAAKVMDAYVNDLAS